MVVLLVAVPAVVAVMELAVVEPILEKVLQQEQEEEEEE